MNTQDRVAMILIQELGYAFALCDEEKKSGDILEGWKCDPIPISQNCFIIEKANKEDLEKANEVLIRNKIRFTIPKELEYKGWYLYKIGID